MSGDRQEIQLLGAVSTACHAEDVGLCLEVGTFPFAMVADREAGHIVLRPVPVRRAT